VSTYSNPSPNEWPTLTIPEHHWEENGETDKSSRLSAAIYLNGVGMHFEARAVIEDEQHCQVAVGDWTEDVDTHLATIVQPDGPWETWTIRGREYIIFAYPFGA
jgi:hypothetical protein